MVKADIAMRVYERTGFTKKECMNIVEYVFNTIKDTVEAGEEVKLTGFGVFQIQHKLERRGRNPHTGDELMLAPRKRLKWKPSALLKQSLNSVK